MLEFIVSLNFHLHKCSSFSVPEELGMSRLSVKCIASNAL